MESFDGTLGIDIITPPYYMASIREIEPGNPMVNMLFFYLGGRINKYEYDKYIDLFKDSIGKKKDIYEQILIEEDIDYENIDEELEEIVRSNDDSFAYQILSQFFEMNFKIYELKNGLLKVLYDNNYFKGDRTANIYKSEEGNFYPILEQRLNGEIYPKVIY